MILQVGVKALITNSEGEYLFLKRSQAMEGENQPSWDIPGGRINPEERLEEALTREILEETGLKVSKKLTILAAQDIFVPGKDMHVVRLTFQTSSSTANVQLSEEHTDFCWISLKEAQLLNLDPYLKEVISSLS